MISAPQSIPLSPAEVQAALRLAGLPPGPSSPFAHLQPPASLHPSVAASLQSKQVVNGTGVVSETWRRALTTLTMPSHRAGIHLGSAGRWFSTVYYGSPSGIAGFAEDQTEYRITVGCTQESMQAPLADWLHWRSVPEVPSTPVDLRIPELAALAAIVDATREETLRAMLERRSPKLERFTRDQLLYEIAGADAPDMRWLCSLLRQRGPAAAAPTAGQFDPGVRMLAERGWVVVEPAAVVIGEKLRAIALSMANLNPHIAMDCREGSGAASTLILTSGLRSYWGIELAGAAAGTQARLTELGGPGAGQRIASYLNLLPASAPVAAASWTPAVPVAPLAVPVAAVAAAPVRTHCGKCGKALLQGRTFCTGCGAPIG